MVNIRCSNPFLAHQLLLPSTLAQGASPLILNKSLERIVGNFQRKALRMNAGFICRAGPQYRYVAPRLPLTRPTHAVEPPESSCK